MQRPTPVNADAARGCLARGALGPARPTVQRRWFTPLQGPLEEPETRAPRLVSTWPRSRSQKGTSLAGPPLRGTRREPSKISRSRRSTRCNSSVERPSIATKRLLACGCSGAFSARCASRCERTRPCHRAREAVGGVGLERVRTSPAQSDRHRLITGGSSERPTSPPPEARVVALSTTARSRPRRRTPVATLASARGGESPASDAAWVRACRGALTGHGEVERPGEALERRDDLPRGRIGRGEPAQHRQPIEQPERRVLREPQIDL